MAKLNEVQEELNTLTAQVQKARNEILTKIAALEEAANNQDTTPEFDAALAALKAAVQATDDVVPDGPTPEPAS